MVQNGTGYMGGTWMRGGQGGGGWHADGWWIMHGRYANIMRMMGGAVHRLHTDAMRMVRAWYADRFGWYADGRGWYEDAVHF